MAQGIPGMMAPREIYIKLFATYGPQGWWPLLSHKHKDPTNSRVIDRYHPGDYSFPKDAQQRFEICMGAILTQNTSWTQAEKAILNLHSDGITTAQQIRKTSIDTIKKAIRPAGYFNQKAQYLKNFAECYQANLTPSRKGLLSIKGIGEETADSILLYAYHAPHFVVDAYTRRIFSHLGHIHPDASYRSIKQFFESQLPRDIKLFQEYHALIVEHAKRYYRRKPYEDPVLSRNV